MPEFPCSTPVTVDARLAGGSLELIAEPRETATVEVAPYDDSDAARDAAERTQVEFTVDRLVIAAPDASGWALRWRAPRVRVTVRVPTDSSGRLRSASAETSCHGQWAAIQLNTASGAAEIDRVTGDLTVNTASGNLRADQAGGRLTVKTASGDVTARQVGGSADVKTASGNVQLDDAGADANVKTASGDVRVGAARHGTVSAHTVSGDVSVGVVTGTGVWMDLSSVSGQTRSDLAMSGEQGGGGHQLTIQARTVSGNIDVHRVTTPTAA